jgi:putative copper export protein
MLPVTATTVRLFLHVLAATVWVGGQITLAGLLPSLRTLGEDAPRTVARRFNRIAWPAFAVLVVTGVWNVVEVHVGDTSIEYQITLFVKLLVVAASGISAAAHIGAASRQALAFWGALSGLTALAAVFLGIMLAAG